MPPSAYRSAIAHLKRADPVLAGIIDRVGPCRLEPRRTGTHYDALVRSIVFQ
jgi:DNA-3-methyladenine glycosylase II